MVRHAKYMHFDQRRRARLSIHEAALGAWYTQLTTSLGNKTSTIRREAATTLLGGAVPHVANHRRRRRYGDGPAEGYRTTLCWLDSYNNKRRTVVHAMHCTRNCGTLRVLNPTWRMRKAVRTQFLEDKLRFETGGGERARSRHHHRLERCSPHRQPDHKSPVHTIIHDVHT